MFDTSTLQLDTDAPIATIAAWYMLDGCSLDDMWQALSHATDDGIVFG